MRAVSVKYTHQCETLVEDWCGEVEPWQKCVCEFIFVAELKTQTRRTSVGVNWMHDSWKPEFERKPGLTVAWDELLLGNNMRGVGLQFAACCSCGRRGVWKRLLHPSCFFNLSSSRAQVYRLPSRFEPANLTAQVCCFTACFAGSKGMFSV